MRTTVSPVAAVVLGWAACGHPQPAPQDVSFAYQLGQSTASVGFDPRATEESDDEREAVSAAIHVHRVPQRTPDPPPALPPTVPLWTPVQPPADIAPPSMTDNFNQPGVFSPPPPPPGYRGNGQ